MKETNSKVIPVVSPSMPPLDEYMEEISSLWETKQLTHSGPKHVELQKQLEDFLEVEHVTLYANGHLALEAALDALNLEGEVITTPFTFASTTQAILRQGLKPVFCDINPNDYTIDVSKIEELITEKTCAILPVHVYGNICDVEEIDRIAKKHNLKVIYDAAHAFHEDYKGQSVAGFGDMSMFSFHATKVFNTVEGGCLTYRDDLVDLLNSLKQFGQKRNSDEVPYIGTNAKMTEVHAAMGLCNLRHIEEYIEKRKNVIECYRSRLSNIDGVRLCPIQQDVKNNYAYFPVVFDSAVLGMNRDHISDVLAKHNVYARKYFYPLTSDFECCENVCDSANLPVADYISKNVLTLPCYSDLEIADVNRICDIILTEISR